MTSVGHLSFDDLPAALARELHDSVAQSLTGLLVEMENFKVGQYGRRSVIDEIDGYQRETRDVLNRIRQVLFELRGEDVATPEFVPALRERIGKFSARYRLPIRLLVSRQWPERMSAQAAKHLSGILDEALHNARRHSGASRADVRLGVLAAGTAVLTVRDDGRGITPGFDMKGMGLTGIRERVLLLGGALEIKAATPHGTIVRAAFPKERLQ